MVLNTVSVGAAVAPVVFQTFITHYFQRGPRKEKPTAHISYDEGLNLIRKFLIYASHHTVEDIQHFTAQWVPHPYYVKVQRLDVPSRCLEKAGTIIEQQMMLHGGIMKVGGYNWWKWRRPGSELEIEWIEMKSDYQERIDKGEASKRVMFYVHGGAYFFGSTDEHRYQMQRHARKLKARVMAPRYRLAPQFPFPCGIYDCLAAYLFLLESHDPKEIVLAGDSAGGGMVLSLLVILRDSQLPLPAGAILISPWVDLTHSFPSVAGDNKLDYIPAHGFHQRPSLAWPPPNADDLRAIKEEYMKNLKKKKLKVPFRKSGDTSAQGLHVDHHPPPPVIQTNTAGHSSSSDDSKTKANTIPGSGGDLSIEIDGELVVIKDQIQMYATNELISHPLVSPALQPTLGGLPPLLILTGGGEMLRDEQIYVAHKAANPAQYPPASAFLNKDHDLNKYPPTDVQLQVWDDLCHVTPTLSFTRPAKYMYRSIAQFGAWALAKAQKTEIEILDDDDVSVISRSSESGEDTKKNIPSDPTEAATEEVGKAGDPLPPFKDHMIRQRIDRHGRIFPLAPESELPACNMSPEEIGMIKPGPVRKWIGTKKVWDSKYSNQKRSVQKKRAEGIAIGYEKFGDDIPPPSALAGRRLIGVEVKPDKPSKKSWGMAMWSGWGSKHDELTMNREENADKAGRGVTTTTASAGDGAGARDYHDINEFQQDMTNDVSSKDVHESSASGVSASRVHTGGLDAPDVLVEAPTFERGNQENIVRYNENGDERRRPTVGGIASPFAIKMGGEGVDGVMQDGVRERNASIGVSGREATASMESLVSTRDELPEGYEWIYDNKEGRWKGKCKRNKRLNLGDDYGIGAESSAVESGVESVSENEGQGGLTPVTINTKDKRKGKQVATQGETGLGTEMETELETKANTSSVSPCLSAVGGQARPPLDRSFSVKEEVSDGGSLL